MKKHTVNFEPLEKRKLFTAPIFSALTGVSHSGGLNGGNVSVDNTTGSATLTTPIDEDSTLDISFESNGHGSLDTNTSNGHFIRGAIQITDLTTNTVLQSSDQLTSGTMRASDLQRLKTSGGGDDIIIQPKMHFTAGDQYELQLNQIYTGVNSNNTGEFIRTVDTTHVAAATFTFNINSFITQPPAGISFTPTTQAGAGTHAFTGEAIGPDGRLYAATTTGQIYSYAIGSNGTLSDAKSITAIMDNNETSSDPAGNRIITGIAFDPGSTASNLVLWVSHGAFQFGNDGTTGTGVEDYAPNFSGKISRINFNTTTQTWDYQDLIVNIPRSVKDHMNNQLVFSPDGKAVYFGIAAMNAMGGSNDSVWGNRLENIYSATIMQLRVGGTDGITNYMHTAGGPVNLLLDNVNGNGATGIDPTTGTTVGTHYNIFKGSNPLRIYADGIRNDFDMVFGSNGHLYAAINGSSAGGNTPATPANLADVPNQNRLDKAANGAYTGPTVPALTGVNLIEQDDLLDVTNGAYYGHPDPARGEYILDAGNPTSSNSDPYEFPGNGTDGYTVGQEPDRNYHEPIYDFGDDQSPDGIIQYKAVNGVNENLNGSLVVARYSSGGDLLGLTLNSSGGVATTQEGITGATGLGTPLDVVENPKTGDLYVSVLTDETGQLNNSGSIVLLKAPASSTGTPAASSSKSKLSYTVTPGGAGETESVTITNTGTGNLVLTRSATKITSSTGNRGNFGVTNLPSAATTTIAAGDSITLKVVAAIAKGDSGTKKAHLAVALNDPSLSGGYLIVSLIANDATQVSASSIASSAANSLISSKLSTSSIVSQLSTKDTVDSLLS